MLNPSVLEQTLTALRIGLLAKPEYIHLTAEQAQALMDELQRLNALMPPQNPLA